MLGQKTTQITVSPQHTTAVDFTYSAAPATSQQ
jgi:hypothetical protein